MGLVANCMNINPGLTLVELSRLPRKGAVHGPRRAELSGDCLLLTQRNGELAARCLYNESNRPLEVELDPTRECNPLKVPRTLHWELDLLGVVLGDQTLCDIAISGQLWFEPDDEEMTEALCHAFANQLFPDGFRGRLQTILVESLQRLVCTVGAQLSRNEAANPMHWDSIFRAQCDSVAIQSTCRRLGGFHLGTRESETFELSFSNPRIAELERERQTAEAEAQHRQRLRELELEEEHNRKRLDLAEQQLELARKQTERASLLRHIESGHQVLRSTEIEKRFIVEKTNGARPQEVQFGSKPHKVRHASEISLEVQWWIMEEGATRRPLANNATLGSGARLSVEVYAPHEDVWVTVLLLGSQGAWQCLIPDRDGLLGVQRSNLVRRGDRVVLPGENALDPSLPYWELDAHEGNERFVVLATRRKLTIPEPLTDLGFLKQPSLAVPLHDGVRGVRNPASHLRGEVAYFETLLQHEGDAT